MWPGEMKLEPKTAQEVNECIDPRGMRKRLTEYAYRGGYMYFVKAIFDHAEIQGLSGEDKMTWLAFEALKALEKVYDAQIEQAMLNVRPPIIPSPLLFEYAQYIRR